MSTTDTDDIPNCIAGFRHQWERGTLNATTEDKPLRAYHWCRRCGIEVRPS